MPSPMEEVQHMATTFAFGADPRRDSCLEGMPHGFHLSACNAHLQLLPFWTNYTIVEAPVLMRKLFGGLTEFPQKPGRSFQAANFGAEDGNGYISRKSLLKLLGDSFEGATVDELLREVDPEDTGAVPTP